MYNVNVTNSAQLPLVSGCGNSGVNLLHLLLLLLILLLLLLLLWLLIQAPGVCGVCRWGGNRFGFFFKSWLEIFPNQLHTEAKEPWSRSRTVSCLPKHQIEDTPLSSSHQHCATPDYKMVWKKPTTKSLIQKTKLSTAARQNIKNLNIGCVEVLRDSICCHWFKL